MNTSAILPLTLSHPERALSSCLLPAISIMDGVVCLGVMRLERGSVVSFACQLNNSLRAGGGGGEASDLTYLAGLVGGRPGAPPGAVAGVLRALAVLARIARAASALRKNAVVDRFTGVEGCWLGGGGGWGGGSHGDGAEKADDNADGLHFCWGVLGRVGSNCCLMSVG